MLSIGTYVCLKSRPRTHKGTIAGAAVRDGKLYYIFHMDERIMTISYADRYVTEDEVQRCSSPNTQDIELINKMGRELEETYQRSIIQDDKKATG